MIAPLLPVGRPTMPSSGMQALFLIGHSRQYLVSGVGHRASGIWHLPLSLARITLALTLAVNNHSE